MEMERINENTIRVLVDNDDLSARGITILDLLGDLSIFLFFIILVTPC